MGDFSREWLARREDADARARSATLVDRLADWLARERRAARGAGSPLTLLDLGCGTGANLRYLAPRLSRLGAPRQRWICLDRDADLLADLVPRTADWAAGLGLTLHDTGQSLAIPARPSRPPLFRRVATGRPVGHCPTYSRPPGSLREAVAAPLSAFPPAAPCPSPPSAGQPPAAVSRVSASQPSEGEGEQERLRRTATATLGLRGVGPGTDWEVGTEVFDLARGADALPIDSVGLVTASALLDLVSEAWLAGLLRACVRTRTPLLLALTYDGRVAIEPGHALDPVVIGLVNAHQRRDKGLGPALGPGAPARLARLAADLGLSVALARSDWQLGPGDAAVQRTLTEGWTAAALEQAGAPGTAGGQAVTASIARWHDRRSAEIAAGRSRIRVGHQDALLLPRPAEEEP